MFRPGSPEGATETHDEDGISVVPAGLDGAGRDAPRVQGLTPPGYRRPPLRGFRPLSRALAGLMGGVASTANHLAGGEGGLSMTALRRAIRKPRDPHPAVPARPHKWGSPRSRGEKDDWRRLARKTTALHAIRINSFPNSEIRDALALIV